MAELEMGTGMGVISGGGGFEGGGGVVAPFRRMSRAALMQWMIFCVSVICSGPVPARARRRAG